MVSGFIVCPQYWLKRGGRSNWYLLCFAEKTAFLSIRDNLDSQSRILLLCQKTPLPVPRITKIKTIVCHLNYSAKTNIKLGISANLIVKEFTEYFKPFASLVGGTEYWCKSSNFMSRRGSCLGISHWIWTWEVRMISIINNQDSLCNHIISLLTKKGKGQRRKTHQPALYDNWNPIERNTWS
jgi:hypothetical protein